MFIKALFLFFIYSFACLSIGTLLFKKIDYEDYAAESTSVAAVFVTSFLMGQGYFAILWSVLALVGFFKPLIVVFIVVFSLLIGIRDFLYTFSKYRYGLSLISKDIKEKSLSNKLVLVLVIILILIYGIATQAPLLANSDADAYYMPQAKVIAAAQHLVPLKGYDLFFQNGFQGELHYAALLLFNGGFPAARLFAWLTGLMTALMLLALGEHFGLRSFGKKLLLAILFTSSAFTTLLSDGKVDLFATVMGIASIYWLVKLTDLTESKIRLIAVFSGIAILAKLSYIPSLIPVIFIIFFSKWLEIRKNKSTLPVQYIKSILVFAFWFLLPLVPHLIKNGIAFGNPLVPFINSPSSGQNWLSQTWFSPEITRRIILTYPFALVFGNYPMQGGTLSPLLIAFAPAAIFFFYKSKNRSLLVFTLAAVAGVIAFIVVRPSVFAPRYILSTLLLFLVPISVGIENITLNEKKPKVIYFGVITCLLIATLSSINLSKVAVWEGLTYGSGIKSQTEYDPIYKMYALLNSQANPGARVLLLTYSRFSLRPDLLQCSSSSEETNLTPLQKSPEEAWTYIYKRGFQFVLLNSQTHQSSSDKLDINRVPLWLKVTKTQEGSCSIFTIQTRDPKSTPEIVTRQVTPLQWQIISVKK